MEQKLVQTYRRQLGQVSTASPDLDRCATMLLLSLGVVQGHSGIGRYKYETVKLGDGILGANVVGIERLDPNRSALDEWEDDLVIFDPLAALRALPGDWIDWLRAAIASPPPFWPAFFRRHRLTW